eukprot:CAMPEP_0116127172 /NCGR_PEP_ID=MMETSP0329-20121206/6705_1 /TAXON_ID=697910 /ORGANISM="Pseudo-nitzschia arenysensis, Strain B593" /LENGTH=117 /DNA_ID=CAMNT_0003621267 /DNA_START=74 /DNA_END=427 /DNA_ORIENTATION=+
MSFRTTTLAVLSTTLAATTTAAEWTCRLPWEEVYGPEDTCPEMNAFCWFDGNGCTGNTRMMCRCGGSGQPWVCSCRGDSFAKENNSTDVESLEISGSVSASAFSAVVMGGMAAAALL